MTNLLSMANPAKVDSFLEEVWVHVATCAAQHGIGDALASALLLQELLSDCHMGSSGKMLRDYVTAALDELDTDPGSEAEAEASDRLQIAANALVAKMAETFAMDLETVVIPGARLQ